MTAGHSGQVFSSSKGQLSPPPGAERGKSGGGSRVQWFLLLKKYQKYPTIIKALS